MADQHQNNNNNNNNNNYYYNNNYNNNFNTNYNYYSPNHCSNGSHSTKRVVGFTRQPSVKSGPPKRICVDVYCQLEGYLEQQLCPLISPGMREKFWLDEYQ